MTEKITYPAPAVCRQEILRYAGVKDADSATDALLDACLAEAAKALTYRVCYTELSVDGCLQRFPSQELENALDGCSTVLLFAATAGVDLDRLMTRYGHTSPAKAHMLQAIGAERIEALCDAFCRDMAQQYGMSARPRFSPGYGDLPLGAQKEIFRLLEPMKHIGLSLTDSLLMSPSKSVTAFVGLTPEKTENSHKCSQCPTTGCPFRSTP